LTLTAHAIVGGAIASLLPNHPALAIGLAFLSHFVLDALPHRDYPVRSSSISPHIAAPMKYDRALLADLITIGLDALAGLVLALFVFATRANLTLIFSGACAAILPDALQFAYMRFPHEPLASLQRFHQWVHTSSTMKDKVVLAVISQFAFVVVCVLAARLVMPMI
jgi:hypothetical protein